MFVLINHLDVFYYVTHDDHIGSDWVNMTIYHLSFVKDMDEGFVVPDSQIIFILEGISYDLNLLTVFPDFVIFNLAIVRNSVKTSLNCLLDASWDYSEGDTWLMREIDEFSKTVS